LRREATDRESGVARLSCSWIPVNRPSITVVETPEFVTATRKLLTEEERAVLVDYLAHNPTAGDLIQGTGGVRKLRLRARGTRKAQRRARDLFLLRRRHSAVRPESLF
jgi:hypothetical protein